MLAAAWSRVKAFGTQPSAVLRIRHPLVAYAVDSSVSLWGLSFDAALQEAASAAKTPEAAAKAQQRVLRAWLPSERRYADPVKR
jgi:hypothetical protein